MWTRKAVFYVGFGTILVLFAPFINNLQLFLLGATVLGFVAIHSLVNTRPIDVKITRDFDEDQVFENSGISVDFIVQNKGRPVGFLEIYDMYTITLTIQVRAHFRVPKAGLVPKMHASLQHFSHAD